MKVTPSNQKLLIMSSKLESDGNNKLSVMRY